ncbi:MAG: hypothetical protein OER80_07350 [Gammaproteobacteria bacterium]|nr:hypothetical protein [Gammaproteobacteria bacterium]MDH3767199.1 hypothetical protein [Gammaproteobacteria bacterium]
MTPGQKEQKYRFAEQIVAEQSFRRAVGYGLATTLAAAGVWAIIAAAAGMTAGFMAVGLGAAVGYAIQFFGRGIEVKYAVLAFALAIGGTVLGNILAALLVEITKYGTPALELLSGVTVGSLISFVVADMDLIGLAFWIMAVSAAAYLANRRLTHAEELAVFALRFKN